MAPSSTWCGPRLPRPARSWRSWSRPTPPGSAARSWSRTTTSRTWWTGSAGTMRRCTSREATEQPAPRGSPAAGTRTAGRSRAAHDRAADRPAEQGRGRGQARARSPGQGGHAMSIRISYEGPRGCGHRKAGGIYLVAPGVGAPCGRFPLPVDRCPTCSHGLKQTRGFTWFDPRTFWGPAGCAAVYGPPQAQNRCQVCPAGLALPERAGLLWIGAQYYPTPADFLTEAREQGISRRIAQVPRELEIGQTWIFLAPPRVLREAC